MEKKEENKNLEWYFMCADVPKEAKKTIAAGRLKGMTDIKPQWRLEKLTEMFGPVGLGWKTIITNKEIIEGANGEKIAIVDINLFVKYGDKWSEAIEGTGGSSFISKEKNGLYTSDECFKMAYTDALSVACKSIGIASNVYWGDSKYITDLSSKKNGKEDNTPELASKAQIETLEKIYKDHEDKKQAFLDKNNLKSFADLPKSTASDLIKKFTAKKE